MATWSSPEGVSEISARASWVSPNSSRAASYEAADKLRTLRSSKPHCSAAARVSRLRDTRSCCRFSGIRVNAMFSEGTVRVCGFNLLRAWFVPGEDTSPVEIHCKLRTGLSHPWTHGGGLSQSVLQVTAMYG